LQTNGISAELKAEQVADDILRKLKGKDASEIADLIRSLETMYKLIRARHA